MNDNNSDHFSNKTDLKTHYTLHHLCNFNPLTPTVANLHQTPSIPTAGEIACVFPPMPVCLHAIHTSEPFACTGFS